MNIQNSKEKVEEIEKTLKKMEELFARADKMFPKIEENKKEIRELVI